MKNLIRLTWRGDDNEKFATFDNFEAMICRSWIDEGSNWFNCVIIRFEQDSPLTSKYDTIYEHDFSTMAAAQLKARKVLNAISRADEYQKQATNQLLTVPGVAPDCVTYLDRHTIEFVSFVRDRCWECYGERLSDGWHLSVCWDEISYTVAQPLKRRKDLIAAVGAAIRIASGLHGLDGLLVCSGKPRKIKRVIEDL